MTWWAWLWLATAWSGELTLPGTESTVVLPRAVVAPVEAALVASGKGQHAEAARLLAAVSGGDAEADVRYLEALARYDAGELRGAERVSAVGLQADPTHGGLLVLHGLVLADLGRGAEALGVLERGLRAARGDRDDRLAYRGLLVSGLVHVDAGRTAEARAAWTEAKASATALGDADALAEVDANLRSLDGRAADDPIGQVSEKLSKGDLTAAKALVAAQSGTDHRSQARKGISQALVLRAEGRLDAAAQQLIASLQHTDAGGLIREEVAARLELAHLYHLSGKRNEARGELGAALQRLSGTSFAVHEVDVRVARGRHALLEDRVEDARADLVAAERTAAGVSWPLTAVRLAELRAGVAAAAGDRAAAESALRAAREGWSKIGYPTEAARVACDGIRLAAAAGVDVGAWRELALDAFAEAKDPAGAVHVAIAEGLGHARAKKDDAALRSFAAAIVAARAAGGPAGERLQRVAESDAGEVLKRYQPAEAAIAKAKELGLTGALGSHEAYLTARAAYETATRDFQSARYSAARDGFDRAVAGFVAAGEADLAQSARRNRAWSAWNVAAALEPAQAFAAYEALAAEVGGLGDAELEVRTISGAAIAAGRLQRTDAVTRLRTCAARADAAKLPDLSGRCYGELVQQALPLDERVTAAREAARRRPDRVGAVALYRAAVEAFNAEQFVLAEELLVAARPIASDLAGDVEALLAKARAAR